jgi:tetratricopeptide (TPR) repeat protein
MRLSIIIEVAILVIFLITIPIIMLVERNTALSSDAKANESAKAYLQKGDQFYSQKKINEASVQYWEASKRDPNLAEAHFMLAQIYFVSLWNYEALSELHEIEKINPKYPQLYLLMGKIHNRMADINKAFDAFQRSLVSEPNNSEAHYYLGTIYQQRNAKEEATKEYEIAVANNTSTDKEPILNSYLQLGRMYKTDKDLVKSVEMLIKALAIDPKSVEVISELTGVYSQQAGVYKSERKFDEAAKIYEEIVKLDPKNLENIEYYLEMGSIYRSLQQYDKAITAYTTITKLDPTNFDSFASLKELNLLKNNGESNP